MKYLLCSEILVNVRFIFLIEVNKVAVVKENIKIKIKIEKHNA